MTVVNSKSYYEYREGVTIISLVHLNDRIEEIGIDFKNTSTESQELQQAIQIAKTYLPKNAEDYYSVSSYGIRNKKSDTNKLKVIHYKLNDSGVEEFTNGNILPPEFFISFYGENQVDFIWFNRTLPREYSDIEMDEYGNEKFTWEYHF